MRHDLEQSEQEQQQPQSRRRFPLYRVLIAVLLILLVGLQYRLWVSDGSLAEVHRLQQEKQALEAAITQARTRNEALAAEIENLKTGDEAMIGRARSDIGMIKKGETFYLTVTPQELQASDAAADPSRDTDNSAESP